LAWQYTVKHFTKAVHTVLLGINVIFPKAKTKSIQCYKLNKYKTKEINAV